MNIRAQLQLLLDTSRSIRRTLDISEDTCSCCYRVRKKKWDDYKLYKELGALQQRLTKWIERIDNGSFNKDSGGD